MPTYEYACKACGTHIDVVQAFTDDALTTCEACGGELRKVFGAVGISFKGSGFYKNDSRSSSSTAAKSDSAAASSSDSKTETSPAKSDSPKSEPASKPASSSDSAKAS